MKQKLLYIPAIIVLCIFMVIPLLSILVPSIWQDGYPFPKYVEFFITPYNIKILARTLRISIIVTMLCALLGLPTAYFISGVDKKLKGILMALTLFPLLTNSVVRSFAWINILGKNGVINNIFLSLGLIEKPLSMLYSEGAIIVGSVYLFLPTMTISLVGVMDHIETEVLEAAATLGMNKIKTFVNIIVPLSVPGMLIGSVLVFTGTLTAYTTPQLLGGNKNMMLSTFLQQSALTLGNWNTAGVVAFIMIGITLLVMKILNIAAKKLDRRAGGDI